MNPSALTRLWLLVTLDCALMGYRLAMGRSALLDKRSFHFHASMRAAVLAQPALGTVSAIAELLIALGPKDLATSFTHAIDRLLLIAIPYAALILATTVLCAVPSVVVRTGASVIVFGPFTLLRPYVVLTALLFAVVPDLRWQVVLVGTIVLLPGTLLEPNLDRRIANELLRNPRLT